MAKMMPNGTAEAVAPHLVAGEPVVAAAPLINMVSTGGQAITMLLGSEFGQAVDEKATPRPGLAGTVPGGKILLAVTDRRVVVFAADKRFRPLAIATWFDRGYLGSITYLNTVLRNEVEIRFIDGTVMNGAIHTTTHKALARRTAKAADALQPAAAPTPPQPPPPG